MRNFLGICVLCSILANCGSSSTLTSSQELSALQGAWSGSATSGYTGSAALTVNGAEGSLSIPSANCPVTFNLPLTMQPGKALVGSTLAAPGVSNNGNGYWLTSLWGTFSASSQLTLRAIGFKSPCLNQAVDAQFTLTK
jgi:hypothetical protein